jgi:hypothetical protein
MLQNIWEPGTLCKGCKKEFGLGQEAIYGRCLDCAQGRAQAANVAVDAVTVAREKLATPGRLTLTPRQLRELVKLADLTPVRKPDAGKRLVPYGRMAGWSAARVEAGLCPQEVVGLWLDFLDVGKVPPVRHADLEKVLAVIGTPDTIAS